MTKPRQRRAGPTNGPTGGVDARAIKPTQTGDPPDDDAGYVATVCGDDGDRPPTDPDV